MKVLVSSFDAFGADNRNPSLEALRALDVTAIKRDFELVKLELPTSFKRAEALIRETIEREQPDAVLALGLAGGRSAVTPERVAINVSDARMSDNDGEQPEDQVIVSDGPAAYFSTLPIKAIVNNLKDAKIPAAVSNTAGTYVCNHVMYSILDLLSRQYPSARGGFMHIPYMSEQLEPDSEQGSLPLEQIVKAVEITVATIVDEHRQLTQ